MKVRCSGCPLHGKCGESATPPEIKIDSDNLPARKGSCTHQMLEYAINYGLDSPPPASKYMKRWGIHQDHEKELNFLAWSGLNIWFDLHESMTLIATEREMHGHLSRNIILSGHPDVLAYTKDNTLVVIDFKSGRVDKDFDDQLMGYAWLAWKAHPQYERAKLITVWLRDGETDILDVSREDLDEWVKRMVTTLKNPTFNPGHWCITEYCDRRYECPAIAQRIQAISEWVRFIGTTPDTGFHAQMGDLALQFPDTRMLKKVIKEYEDTFKDGLQLDTGTYPDGQGKECSYKEQSEDKVLPDVAMPIVRDYLGVATTDDAIEGNPEVFSISKSKLQDAVTAGMEKGKGLMKQEITDALRGANALRPTTKRLISHKKAPKEKKG